MGPTVWTRQPQFPARPNRTDLTRGLVLLWNGATPSFAPIAGIPTSINGGASLRSFVNTVSPDFNGTSVDYRWNRAVTGTNPSEATLFALCSTDSGGERTLIGMSRSSNNNPLFRIELNGTGFWQAQFRGDGATVTNVTGGGAPSTNRLYFIVGVFRSGTGQKELWIDGVQGATSTTDIGTITLDQTEIGVVVRSGAVQWWDGVIPLAGIYNRALSPAEIATLSKNPWQLFQPISRRIFVASTGTGPTYTLTAAQGSFTLTGQAAGLTASRLLTAAQGSFALTGQAATLKAARLITAAQGSYTLTGQDATLTYTPAVTYTLTAAQGAFTLTGQAAGLTAARLLTAAQGTYSLTGVAAGLTYSGEPQTITTIAGGVKKKPLLHAFFVALPNSLGNKTTSLRSKTWLSQSRVASVSSCRKPRHCKQSRQMFRSSWLRKSPGLSLESRTYQ
jgi:Concanavalin A-like lectin/glucanases superfamily